MIWMDQEQIKKNVKLYSSKQLAFRTLLGGIGTGNISLDAWGRLCDFEILNHPDKKLKIPYTFFSMWYQFDKEAANALVLEVKPDGISNKALGHPTGELLGLPRFDEGCMEVVYPFSKLTLKKEKLPLDITMEAFTPFIPLDANNSGIPGFQMKYTVKNSSLKKAEVSICGTMYNFCGFGSYDGFDRLYQEGSPYNRLKEEKGLKGILFGVNDLEKESVNYGTIALSTSNQTTTVKPYWQFGGWWDGAEEFWQDFKEDGELTADVSTDSIGSNINATAKQRYVGSVASKETILPGETKEFVFYISWHFPNRYGWWPDGHCLPEDMSHRKVWKNYYSTVWTDAWDVTGYFYDNLSYLTLQSKNFGNALYGSTLDPDVIESLVSAITVLRSPTCFRIAGGKFFAWEGCFDHAGSCAGTCTHVWNYAQALAFLFPELERSARETEFLDETDETGNMAFRARRLLDGKAWDMLPAADGQLGSILRVYREWKLSGDTEFLKKLWNKVVLALEFSLKTWDSDGDYVLDTQQHNTYDIEFYGLNPLTNSILYAALKACSEMAEYLGDKEHAKEWGKAAKAGSEKMDRELFNGSYYQQKISEEELNKYKYQFGRGCLSDQLLGQELAHVYGLGYILPKEHVSKAMQSVYEYNFLKTLENHHSVQRSYAYQDESGLILCSWPNGGRPKQPFVYSDEIWTGIEYQVAVHLIYEGMYEEAMDIVRAIRNRYNGNRRSPYNEIECGNHYARSMAAWGLLTALSGYQFDLPHHKISFEPKVNQEHFRCFYSNGTSWGVYMQEKDENGKLQYEIVPLYGTLEDVKVN